MDSCKGNGIIPISKFPIFLSKSLQCNYNQTKTPSTYGSQSTTFNDMNTLLIIQNAMLAHGQYFFSLAILMGLLLHFQSNTFKDAQIRQVNLFKNFISLVKLFHWNNCDYLNIAFTTSCFLLFIGLLPFLIILWCCVLCYRQYIYFIIKVSPFLCCV